MNIIYQSTGVRYNEVHICGLLYKWDSNQKYHEKDLSILHQKKRKGSSKKFAGNNIKYTQRIHYSSRRWIWIRTLWIFDRSCSHFSI